MTGLSCAYRVNAVGCPDSEKFTVAVVTSSGETVKLKPRIEMGASMYADASVSISPPVQTVLMYNRICAPF